MSSTVFALPPGTPKVLDNSELIKILTGLLLVLFIIIVLSWVVKRFNVIQLSSSKGFEAIANMTLGPKEKITLLKVGNRYLLVGIGSASINTLYDFGEQLPDGFGLENKTSFADLLKSVVRKS
jgi:flagellar protein FliO/FliZ